MIGVVVGEEDSLEFSSLGGEIVEEIEETLLLREVGGRGVDDVDSVLADDEGIRMGRGRLGESLQRCEEDSGGEVNPVELSFVVGRREPSDSLDVAFRAPFPEEKDHRRRNRDLTAPPPAQGFLRSDELPGHELPVPDVDLRLASDQDPQELGVEPHDLKRRRRHSAEGLEIARVEVLSVPLQDGGKLRLPLQEPSAVLAELVLLGRLRSPGNPEARLFEELSSARGEERSERGIGDPLDGNVPVPVVDRSAGKRMEPSEESELAAPLDQKDFGGPVAARDRETHRST